MKILLTTDYYPPESNAPALRCSYHAEYWAKKGHEVTVLTCAPNFPNGVLYNGYKNRFISTSIVNGVKVVRCWSFIFKNEGYFFRILDHLSSALMFAIAPIFMKRPDVVIATSPQFLTLVSGYISSSLIRRPLVSEIRDMWPEGIIFLSKSSLTYKILEKLETFLYRGSSKIIVVTASFAKSIKQRIEIPSNNICIAYNGCNDLISDLYVNDTTLRSKLGLEGKFVVGYAGTVGVSHGIDSLINAFKGLDVSLGAYLVVVGSGAMHKKLKFLIKERSLTNILVIDSVPKKDIGAFLSMFDASLVSLKDVPAYDKVIPSKLFEAAAYDNPVIAGLRGEAKSIVQDYEIGELFDPENIPSFVGKLTILISNLKKNKEFYGVGLSRVRKDFSRDRQAQLVLDCILELK
jgi:glycosyltransferase involved in cell wall biosynthesis